MRRGEAMPRFQGEKTVVKREKQNTNNSLIPIKNIYIHYHEFKKIQTIHYHEVENGMIFLRVWIEQCESRRVDLRVNLGVWI